jgi:hypothetical protein
MQKVYLLCIDGGDGSVGTLFYRKEPDIEALTDEEPEVYGCNDGSLTELTFPDDLDLHACGFRFSDND